LQINQAVERMLLGFILNIVYTPQGFLIYMAIVWVARHHADLAFFADLLEIESS